MDNNQKDMIDILEKIAGKHSEFVVNDPEEGNYCFFCGNKYSYSTGIQHDKKCVYTEAEKMLRRLKKLAKPVVKKSDLPREQHDSNCTLRTGNPPYYPYECDCSLSKED